MPRSLRDLRLSYPRAFRSVVGLKAATVLKLALQLVRGADAEAGVFADDAIEAKDVVEVEDEGHLVRHRDVQESLEVPDPQLILVVPPDDHHDRRVPRPRPIHAQGGLQFGIQAAW